MPTVSDEPHWVADMEEEKYLPYVAMPARMNFECFYGLDPGTATSKMIDTRSSLTVAGWADVVLGDYGQIDRERIRRDGGGCTGSPTSGCWAFGRDAAHGGRDDVASQAACDHNGQVAKLLALWERVVRDAVPFSERWRNAKVSRVKKSLKIFCMGALGSFVFEFA